VQVTDSSVGPYTLSITVSGATARHAAQWRSVSGSPTKMLYRNEVTAAAGRLPSVELIDSTDGTEYQWVSRRPVM
jgi:hypothetical protein